MNQDQDAPSLATKVVRRVDLRLLPLVCSMYILSYIDRVNIGFAKIYGIEDALELTPEQFGWALSIFFVGYISFQLPSNLLLKRLSPNIWFSIILTTWGGLTIAMAFTKSFAALSITRVFLGVAEAGLFPGIIFCTGMWYTRQEQGIRIGLISSSNVVAGAMGGVIAYLVHGLDKKGDLSAWQWLFILEGIPTVLLGLCIWYLMPKSPQEANFLSRDDQLILKQRLEASHVDLDMQDFNRSQAWEVIKDIKLYLYAITNLCFLVPTYSTGLFLPSLVKNLGFDSLEATLLTVPPNLIGFAFTLILSRYSDRHLVRGYYCLLSALVGILGFSLLSFSQSTILRYLSLAIINGGLSAGVAINLSWSNNNFVGSTRAAIAPPVIVMTGCVGGIVGGQFYRDAEAPLYLKSHLINIGCLVAGIISITILRFLLVRANRILERGELKVDDDIIKKASSSSLPSTTTTGFRYIL